jgi:pyruvate kinase
MSAMLIRTKILATLGPASESPEVLRGLIDAGCDAFRLNFSHGTHEQKAEFISMIRQADAPVAILADLCGPKIRVGPMPEGGVLLEDGQAVTIQREPMEGSAERFSITLQEFIDAAEVDEPLLLDDGKLRLTVTGKPSEDEVTCRVDVGGRLTAGKGVNLPQTDLSLSALTAKDRDDVAWIVGQDIDYVALSFVQRPEDIRQLRAMLDEAGCDAQIIAKLEKPQAMRCLDGILDEADGVMVARGDLGVEMDFPDVPVAQKIITHKAHAQARPCIIATQMLESMIHSPVPSRADVSDVANAVLDYADVVMLSGETAVGDYPVETVRAMNRTAAAIQEYHDEHIQPEPVELKQCPTAAGIAAAVREMFHSVEGIVAVGVFSATGATARVLAKNRLPGPILAASPSVRCVRQMALYYGVEPFRLDAPAHTRELLPVFAEQAKAQGLARPGEKIVVVSGRPLGTPGATNTLVVHTVE